VFDTRPRIAGEVNTGIAGGVGTDEEKHMKHATALLVTVMAVGLGGVPGSRADEPDPVVDQASKPEKTCFRVRDTRGFSAIDDRFVYVRSVRNRHYLLTLDNRCYGLEYSIRIAIANEFDRVCSNDRAVLTYRDFNRLHRCQILDVEAVTGLDEAEVLVDQRRTARNRRKEAGAASE
jgi:hypothetical protein